MLSPIFSEAENQSRELDCCCCCCVVRSRRSENSSPVRAGAPLPSVENKACRAPGMIFKMARWKVVVTDREAEGRVECTLEVPEKKLFPAAPPAARGGERLLLELEMRKPTTPPTSSPP